MQIPNFIKSFLGALIILSFLSCEKEVSYRFKEGAPKLVVEGSIENDQYPIVKLSNSMDFLGVFNFEDIESFFIHDAIVEVSDGFRTVQLKEYITPSFPGFPSFYFYSIDSSKVEDLDFLGELGKSYTLKITIGADFYESITAIPYPKAFDSLWVQKPLPDFQPEDFEEGREIIARYTDPDTLGNSYRIFTSVNHAPFLAPRSSVISDELGNGTTLDVSLSPGYIPGDTASFERRRYFELNDEVRIKWSAIDRTTYNFYSTLEYSMLTIGNPFSAPIKIKSNIQGKDVLGIWAGYGTSLHEITVVDLEP